MNRVILIGNLGRDAESGETTTGKRWVRLSVATSVSWNDKTTGEKKEKTEWHRIVVWGDGFTAFLADNAKKGGKVLVEGKLSTHEYEKNNVKHWSTEVVVQGPGATVRLLNRPGDGGGVPAPQEPEGRYAGSDYDPGSYA